MTVCPPKDTFTDLNYDLWLANKTKMANETWKELAFKAFELLESETFMENITKLYEKDRFYNWYHGYSSVSSPYDGYSKGFTYEVWTSAVSGEVKSQNFQEVYKEDLLENQ